MPELKFTIASESELPTLCKNILAFITDQKIIALYAEMGSGKTTLVKEICRQLGSTDHFSSPTYSLVNEYVRPNGNKIYHIDLYRLNIIEEAYQIGIEEYLNSGNYCFIEWPELIETILPYKVVKIAINVTDNIRNVSIFMPD
mgnify:CR=1 FL=1